MSPTAYLGVPLRPRCVRCFSPELDWAPSSGRATLYSFALMHQLYDQAFAAELPYNIAVVETEEGVRLTRETHQPRWECSCLTFLGHLDGLRATRSVVS